VKPILDRSLLEPKLGAYAVASAAALSDPALHPLVQDYRRRLSAQMTPLERDDIQKRIPKSDCFVSRKIDGEFTALVFRGGEAFTINPGGAIRAGLPCIEEARARLEKAAVSEAIIAGELYVQSKSAGRPRVHDVVSVARNPQSQEELDRLRFAAFDILSWNGEAPPAEFEPRWERITTAFGAGERVHPVEMHRTQDPAEIAKWFAQWVDDEGAEGLVVRSDRAGMFKIKPRHSIDAVVVGFTESTGDRQGLLHDLLVAVYRNDGALHVLTRVGGGFSEEQRREFLSDLKDLVVESEYAEANADHVAYQMVEPAWVIEISLLDLVSQNTRGGPVQRMSLEWDEKRRLYRPLRLLPLASVISPQFIRGREDKTPCHADAPIEQVAKLVDVPHLERGARTLALPESEVLRREVYVKEMKGQTMVRKFLLWKTNKETENEAFPSYVIHFTDYSPGRKTPLAREIRITNSLEQAASLLESMKEENIKRGWNLHAETTAAPAAIAEATPAPAAAPAPPVAEEAAPAPKKKPAKKPAAAEEAKPPKKKPAAKKKAAPKKPAKNTAMAESERKKAAKKTAMAESERKKTARKKKGGGDEKRA
jgi:ATP-dependent DNA ligase